MLVENIQSQSNFYDSIDTGDYSCKIMYNTQTAVYIFYFGMTVAWWMVYCNLCCICNGAPQSRNPTHCIDHGVIFVKISKLKSVCPCTFKYQRCSENKTVVPFRISDTVHFQLLGERVFVSVCCWAIY